MGFRIGIENNIEGRTLAWVLDHPGCFAHADDEQAVLPALPRAISDYALWIEAREPDQIWLDVQQITLNIDEVWDVYAIDESFNQVGQGYEVNAWFRHDWKPLNTTEIQRARQLLNWTRDDLLDVVSGLSPGALEFHPAGERWSLRGILEHVANSEWWYLDRLGLAFSRERLSPEPLERLKSVRACLMDALPELVGIELVLGIDGEFWSPRKLLRRALWHERDHTQHLFKLI